MKRFFQFPASPLSKKKYEAKRQEIENTLKSIESTKQIIFGNGETDEFDNDIIAEAPVVVDPPTRPVSPSKRLNTVAFSKPSFTNELPMSLAMLFSSMNSFSTSPSKDILNSTTTEAQWCLKDVYLVQENEEEDVKIGAVELHEFANLKAARELILRFIPNVPKGFNFVENDKTIDPNDEDLRLLYDAFPKAIRIRETKSFLSKEERQRRLLVKERQQAAFEHFVQRRTQEPKAVEPLYLKAAQEEETKEPTPVVTKVTLMHEEPSPTIVKPPKHLLWTTTLTLNMHECLIKFLYFPTLARVILRAKITSAKQYAALPIHEAEFRKLVGATEEEALLDYSLNDDNTYSIASNLLLIEPSEVNGLFQLRLKRYVYVVKPRKEHPIVLEEVEDKQEEKSPPKVKVIEPPAVEKRVAPKQPKPIRKVEAPPEHKSQEVHHVEPIVVPEPRAKTSPPKQREKHIIPQKMPKPQEHKPASPVKTEPEPRATTAMPTKRAEHHKAIFKSSEKPVHSTSSEEHHRRIRASLELASRKTSVTNDGDDVSLTPKAAPVVPEEQHVKLALKKLRAFVHSGAAIAMHHYDNYKDEIEKLYASSNPKSISLARHCLLVALWDFLVSNNIEIKTHSIHYTLDTSSDGKAPSIVSQLLLAFEDEIAVCDTGHILEIQHDMRKVVMDDMSSIAQIAEKRAVLGDDELKSISLFEAKLTLICHISLWFDPTQIRTTIFEGVYPMLSKKELPLEELKLTYITAKESPFKSYLMKNQASLEYELKALLEILYILAYNYYNSQRCSVKKLRHFHVHVSTQAERVQVILQAIDEQQAKLREVHLAYSDISTQAHLERIFTLTQVFPLVKSVIKTSKLPSFFKNLATYLSQSFNMYKVRLLSALRSHHTVQVAQSSRFLLEVMRAHVHHKNHPSSDPIGHFFQITFTHTLGLEKINSDRTRLNLSKLQIHSDYCVAAYRHCNILSNLESTKRKARWDAMTDIPSAILQRYFFKGEQESICEFVILVAMRDRPVLSEQLDVAEAEVPQEPLRWEEIQADYIDEVNKIWNQLLHWHQQKSSDMRLHIAFGLNIRQATGKFLTSELLANTNLNYFLNHAGVHHFAIAYTVVDQTMRLTIRFYQEIHHLHDNITTHRQSVSNRYENNAFNEVLLHVASMKESAVDVFLLQKGLHFIMQNLFIQRHHAWERLPKGREFYSFLVDGRLTARYSEELMELALDKIFKAIANNTSLLSSDLLQLLLNILQQANDTCMDKDDTVAVVQTTFEFIAVGAIRLLQHILVTTHVVSPELSIPSLSSAIALPALTSKQKCFIDCDGLGMLHDILSAPTFLPSTVFVDDTTTKILLENLIVQVLLTNEMCAGSRSMIVHHEMWSQYFLPRVEAGDLEMYVGSVLQGLADLVLGTHEKYMYSSLIQCSCGCPRNLYWTCEVYESILQLYLELVVTNAGARWAQEHDMAGILLLIKLFDTFYVQLLTDPLQKTKVQHTLVHTIYTLARKIKLPESRVKFFEIIPLELLSLYTREKAAQVHLEIFRVLASLMHLGILRKIPQLSIGVFGAVFIELTMLIVEAVLPHPLDVIPALWSDANLSTKIFKRPTLFKLFCEEHHVSLALDPKATDRDGTMPSILMLYVNLIDSKLDKALESLQLPAIMGLVCLLYDPAITRILIKDNILVKILELHEAITLPFISTKQQQCIMAVALLCTHIALDGNLATHLSSQNFKRILQHSYSSIARINRSRSNGLDYYVCHVNRTGTIDVYEHPAPIVGKKTVVHDMIKTLTSLKAKMKQIESEAVNPTARDGPRSSIMILSTKQTRLLEWEENLELNVEDRDDRTSTVYFILINAISCMTSSLIAIKDSEEIKVISQSIVSYFIAEELTPPEYFVAAYCFALKNIVFAVFQDISINEIWEQAKLNQFLRKLFGFIQMHQKKITALNISLGQEYSLELLWSLVLASKGKEAWFLKDDSEIPVATIPIPLKTTMSVLTKALMEDGVKPHQLDRAKLKVLGDAAGSPDPVVCEFACAVLATLICDSHVAMFFLTEIGYNKLLTMLQQHRTKSATRQLRTENSSDMSTDSRQIYGSNLLYDLQYKMNRELRAMTQLLRLVSCCIRIVATNMVIPNDYITKSEKPTKDHFVSLIHHVTEPPLLVQVFKGIRYLMPFTIPENFDAYFSKADYERLFALCFEPPYQVQSSALKCARYLIRRYGINIHLTRMMYDARLKLVLLFASVNIKLQIEAVYMLFQISMNYLNKKQRKALAQTFDTEETRPILASLFTKFQSLITIESSKASAQQLMDILIRLIIQLDLLNFVDDDYLVEAICRMIETITPDAKTMDPTSDTVNDSNTGHTPLRPMLCAALAKLVCKGQNSNRFLRISRLDAILRILSQESTLGELMDLACILLTLATEETAIALYFGTYTSQAIKHICHVLCSFYELQMVNTNPDSIPVIDEDDDSNAKAEIVSDTFDMDELSEMAENSKYKKFHTLKQRLLLKIFFPKSEELKISRHLDKIYKYYLKLLAIILEAHHEVIEVHGCRCTFRDGCPQCAPSDLLRKANGANVCRWLLLSRRIPVTNGASYMSAPEKEADAIVFHTLRLLRSACLNHLFRVDFLEGSPKPLASQSTTALLELRTICSNVNHAKLLSSKYTLLDCVLIIGQLCSEDGVREYFGINLEMASYIFTIINDKVQIQVPYMLRATLLVLCRLASSEAMLHQPTFKRTIRLTCSLLEMVVHDDMCMNNMLLFYRNTVAYSKQVSPFIHQHMNDSVLSALCRLFKLTMPHDSTFDVETSLHMAAADSLTHLLFLQHKTQRKVLKGAAHQLNKDASIKSRLKPKNAPEAPIAAVFRRIGASWQQHLDNMNQDDLTLFAGMDDKLEAIYSCLYGEKSEEKLFDDLLAIHTKLPPEPSPREIPTMPSTLVALGPLIPLVFPVYIAMEHPVPADLREYSFHRHLDHVPGSASLWKVLRKLFKSCRQRGKLQELTETQTTLLLRLLAVCAPEGRTKLSASSSAWMVGVEMEYIRFVHDVVHSHPHLRSAKIFDTVSQAALRYFAAAYRDSNVDAFSCRMRGFVLLHAFSSDMGLIASFATHLISEKNDREDEVPTRAHWCLSGLVLTRRKTTWKCKDRAKQASTTLTYLALDIAHSSMLPYALGVFSALVQFNQDFLLWYLSIGGFGTLVEILELEFEYQDAPVVPSRLEILRITLELMSQSINMVASGRIDKPVVSMVLANLRVFTRLLKLTAHTKTEIKQAAMGVVVALTKSHKACEALFTFESHQGVLPILNSHDEAYLSAKLDQLKLLFGSNTIERDGHIVFTDTDTAIDLKKYIALSSVRFLQQLKPTSIIKLTRSMEPLAPASVDTKTLMVMFDGRCISLPLWLIAKYVERESLKNLSQARDDHSVTEQAAAMNALLNSFVDIKREKCHRLSREEYMAILDEKERNMIAQSLWRTLKYIDYVPKRPQLIQQIFRALIEEQACLNRTVRRATLSNEDYAQYRRQFTLNGLFAFLRKSLLLRSLSLESIGAMGRHMPQCQEFHDELLTDTNMLMINQGAITIALRPSIFDFQHQPKLWKRRFGPGDIVWCPSWISSDPRIEPYSPAKYHVIEIKPYTTVFVWSKERHEQCLPPQERDELSQDITDIISSLLSTGTVPIPVRIAEFCREHRNLRQLQKYGLQTLANLASGNSAYGAMLIQDLQLLNAVASIAFSTLDDSLITSAIQALRCMTKDQENCSTFYATSIDLFAPALMLQGVFNNIHLWGLSTAVATAVMELLRQIYKLVPSSQLTIATMWQEVHYKYFRDFLTTEDTLLHEQVAGLIHELLASSYDTTVEIFAKGALHLAFSQLIGRCASTLLPDVLHIVLLFCKEPRIKASIWYHAGFHSQLNLTLSRMVVLLGRLEIAATIKFLAFFNVLVYSGVNSEMDNEYRVFLGQTTHLISFLVNHIVYETNTEYTEHFLDCLWRICHENPTNASRVSSSNGLLNALAAMVLVPTSPLFLNALRCIRSLSNEPSNADTFGELGVLESLFAYITHAHEKSTEIAIPTVCTAMEALSGIFKQSNTSRNRFSLDNMERIATLYNDHIELSPMDLEAWGQILSRLMQLLSCIVLDTRTRQMVWTRCQASGPREIGWTSWMQLLYPPQHRTLAKLSLDWKKQVHNHTIAILAELCLESTIAHSFVSNPNWCRYFYGLLLDPRSHDQEVFESIRLILAIAEYCVGANISLLTILPSRAQIYTMFRLLGIVRVNAKLFRILWLWESQAQTSKHHEHLSPYLLHYDNFWLEELSLNHFVRASMRERCMFLGFLVHLLPYSWALEHSTYEPIGAQLTAKIVATHIYSVLPCLINRINWLQLLGVTAESQLYVYVSWTEPRLAIGVVLQLIHLVKLVLDNIQLQGLLLLREFDEMLYYVAQIVTTAVIDMPFEIALNAFGSALLVEWCYVLRYVYRCRILPQTRGILKQFVSKVMEIVSKSTQDRTKDAALGCVLALCEKNIEVILSLIPLDLVSMLIAQLKSEPNNKHLLLDIMQCLVATSFRHGSRALELGAAQLCIDLVCKEGLSIAPGACLLLTRLIRLFGASTLLQSVDRMDGFVQSLISQQFIDYFAHHSGSLYWMACIFYSAEHAELCQHIVSAWDSNGSSFILQLFGRLHLRQTEGNVCVVHHESIPFTALRLLSHLITLKNDAFLDRLLKLDDAWKHIVDDAFHAIKDTDTNFYAFSLLQTTLLHSSGHFLTSQLFVKLTQVLHNFDLANAARRPLYFELLATYLNVHCVPENTSTFVQVVQLPLMNWSFLFEQCIHGFMVPGWARYSSLQLLHAFLELQKKLASPLVLPPAILINLKSAVQATADSYKDASLLEMEHGHAFPPLGLVASAGLDADIIYASEQAFDLHLLPITDHALIFLQHHASERHILPLLHYSNGVYANQLLGPLRDWQTKPHTRSLRVSERVLSSYHLEKKRGTVAAPGVPSRRSRAMTFAVKPNLTNESTWAGFGIRRTYTSIVNCLLLMEADPLEQVCLYVDQIARATMHCFVNSDAVSFNDTQVWLTTLYFAAAHSSNNVSLLTENYSLIITLIRLAGSRNNRNHRKLATSCLWKILESDTHVDKFPQLVLASNIQLVEHLKLSLTMEAPQLGATENMIDFVLSTIGLLAVLCQLPEILDIILREHLVENILRVVRQVRPSSLNSANCLFLSVIKTILLKNHPLDNVPDIVLHCLRCLELDNKLELRSKAIYVLYLISKLPTGLQEIQEHLFPTTSKDSTTTLQAMAHLFVMTETLKFHHDHTVLMASIYLICKLCDISAQMDCLRGCRESSTESMIDLMAGVLEATIGTKHQNHVKMQQTQLPPILLETGVLTLETLTKFATHYDIFRFVSSGNRIVIQLFASMGWQQLQVSYIASVLLSRIFEFATDPRVEQLLLHMPHDDDSDEDEEGNGQRRTSLMRATSSLQIDRNLPMNHPKRHSLNRFRCFRHKKGGEIPSYFELLTSWVTCFADNLLVEQIPLLNNVFKLLQTTLSIFYATIYLPTTEYCRQHHRHLLRDIFSLTFNDSTEPNAMWQEIQIQGLTIMFHLSSHHQDYPCSIFENSTTIQKLLQLIRTSENQCQFESARLLRAITRHEDVKQVFYRHQLYSYVGWMNEPVFVNILEPFIQSVKNLLVTSKIPGYDPLRLARLLLSAPAQRSSTLLSSHASVFRQVQLRFKLDVDVRRTIKVQMTIQSSSGSRDIYRRYFIPSGKDFGEEILFLELDVRSIDIVVCLANEKENEISFTYDVAASNYSKLFPLSDITLQVTINENTCCDLIHLSGPLGDVLWFCVDHEMQTEIALIEELVGELCKHDDVFCDVELHLWSYVAYLLNYGSKHDNPMAGMHCLKSIADCASTVHKDIYLRHSFNLIQMLDVYNLSSEKNIPHEWASPCLRHKEVSCFLLAIADIVSKCLSKTQAATYMSMLLLEYRGVVRYLCGFHRANDHLCCTSLKIQSQLIQVWPSHALVLSKKRFITENLRYFETSGHLSDTSIDQAAAYIMKLILYTRSCRKFVENQGLELLGKLANVLYLRYCSSSTIKIANTLRQFVLIGALLRGNLLVVTPLPLNIQALFFPKTLKPDVMPYLEMILWPLLKEDECLLDCSQLAATIFVQLSEICLERSLVEYQLIRIAFRLERTRIEELQQAIQRCIRHSSWDQKFMVQAIQKIYYIAVLRGIKTGILSAECKELLPMQAIPKLTQKHDKILHTKHESLQEDNEFHQELLYCLQFTEQHREGRLRDILVRNRKKGIGEMLRAVDNSARLMLFVHRVLQMAVETYNGISCAIPQASAKQEKFRAFCGHLESLALIVVSVLPQLDASYFVHIFYQFRELRFPEARLDSHVIERRHFMRNNMKKLLFLLKRIIDKKKLQSVLDTSSFTAAETILRDIRLDFAANGRRRLGQPCGLDGTIADFLCEAIEMKGMAPFATLLSSARYLYARTMRKDDNTYFELGNFMVGIMKDIGLGKAIQLMLKALGESFIKLIMHPIESVQALYDKFHHKPSTEPSARKSLSRHYSVSLAQNIYRDEERSLISFFPTASVLTLTHHEIAAASSGDLLWEHLRLHCTTRIDGAAVLNSDFVQLMCTRISRAKQEKIESFVSKEDVDPETIDAALNTIDLEQLRTCFEEYLAKTKGLDVDLDIVQHATLPVNVWSFLLGPVYHTKLLHAEYILDEIRKQKAVTIKTAEMVLTTPDTTPMENNDPVKKLSALVTLPLRPKPHLMRKGTSRRNFQRNPIGMNLMKSIGMANLVEMDEYKSLDDIKKEHIDVIYTDYVLPVSDQNLEDPLSEQMAWEYLIIEINRNSFPRWVFEVDDPAAPAYRRLFARGLRWTLRAFLNITFWRLEELKLDLQDDSWPDGEVLRTKKTRRKCLAQDIVHSIVIHKHFKKAISELFTVWMKESGSLGLRFWQHWLFFVFGWLCPVLLFYVILPQIQLDSAQDPHTVDYYMKWVMGSFFLVIFVLVLLSIMQLIKQSENMMVQERQMVRFYPVLGFHGNYLALYGLFMELVQQNTIPFSNSVQWVSGFKLPKAVAALGNLGITGLDVDSLKQVMKPLDLLYFKAYAAITIVLAYMILLKCANKFHKGYPKLNQRLTKDLPPIVSSIMFVAIINTFSSFLFCCTCDQFTDPNSQCSHTQPFLYAYTDVDLVCWSPDHLPLAFIGLVGLSYFLPIGILSAGMGEVLFPRENVDIKFSPIVVLASQMGKTISILASLFFTFYRKYMVTISMITNTGLFLMTIYWKTSSIWYISIIKSSIYIMSVWTSICAFVNITLPNPNSSPVYYLNLGWFIIFCIALLILGLKMRVRNVREEQARRERLRDYQLLNASSEEVRLTDMEEDFMRRSLKHVDSAKLEASAPPGFIEAARAKTKAMEAQQLPPHLDDFLEKARRSTVRPTTSETMFLRRARRLGRRIALFEESENLRESYRKKHLASA